MSNADGEKNISMSPLNDNLKTKIILLDTVTQMILILKSLHNTSITKIAYVSMKTLLLTRRNNLIFG